MWRKGVIPGERYQIWPLTVNVGIIHICQLSFVFFFSFSMLCSFFTLVWFYFFLFFQWFSFGRYVVKKAKCPSSGELKTPCFCGRQKLLSPSSWYFQTQGDRSEGLQHIMLTRWEIQQVPRLCPCRRH